MHQKPGRRDADLARIAKLGAARRFHGQRDVRVFCHDHRRVAAQLHRRALHVLAGQSGELLADWRRARERDLADHGVRDQIFGNLSRVPVDEADHTRRHAGIDERTNQLRRRGGRLLRRFHDDRAAGGERRREFANHLIDRKVPRRKRCNRANRLAQHHLARSQIARRHNAAVDAVAFLRKGVDRVGSGHDLAFGLDQRFALLLGHQLSDAATALPQQGGCFVHQF